MSLPIDRLSSRLPHRFPIGAAYVVEGHGGKRGDLRVISRYVLLPGGRRINVPLDINRPASAGGRACRRTANPRQSQGKGRSTLPGGKNFVHRGGTA